MGWGSTPLHAKSTPDCFKHQFTHKRKFNQYKKPRTAEKENQNMKSIDEYKSRFMQNYKSMISDFNLYRDKDKKEKTDALNFGESLGYPTYNGFYYDNNRENAKNSIRAYREKAINITNELKNELTGIMGDIPSDETTRALQSMQYVKNPDAEYINALLEKHGSNYTAEKAIKEYAREHGVKSDKIFEISETEKANNLYQSLNSIVSKMDISESESFTDGKTAFIEMSLQTF